MKNLYNLTVLLIFIFFFIAGLYLAQGFLIPFAFASLLSFLILPLQQKIENFIGHRIISSFLSVLIIILLASIFFFVIFYQTSKLIENINQFKTFIFSRLEKIQAYFNLNDDIFDLKRHLPVIIQTTYLTLNKFIFNVKDFFISAAIVPIYIFFFLSYRTKLYEFIFKILPLDEHESAKKIINNIRKMTTNYITGLLTVILILSVLNTTGLYLIGIKYPILWGVLAAVLNIIPYIGISIGALLPISFSLITGAPAWQSGLIIILFVFIQLLDNNFLTPFIVGHKVRANPLITFIVAVIGATIWGIPGIILAIPTLGIIKIICDNVESLNPYAYLISD